MVRVGGCAHACPYRREAGGQSQGTRDREAEVKEPRAGCKVARPRDLTTGPG